VNLSNKESCLQKLFGPGHTIFRTSKQSVVDKIAGFVISNGHIVELWSMKMKGCVIFKKE